MEIQLGQLKDEKLHDKQNRGIGTMSLQIFLSIDSSAFFKNTYNIIVATPSARHRRESLSQLPE